MSKNIERFENNMDVSSGEISGDAEKILDYEEKPEDYQDEFESKMRQSKLSTPNLEKAMLYVSAIETLASAFNNIQENSDRPKKVEEFQAPLTSISTGAYDYMDSSVSDILRENGFELPTDDNETTSFPEMMKEIIEAVGGDEDEALISPEEQKEKRDEIIDEEIASRNNAIYSNSLDIQPLSLPAYSSIVSENFEYGIGGGTQIFIPNANEYKNNGILEKIDEIYEDDSTEDDSVNKSIVPSHEYIDEQEIELQEEYLDDIDYLDKNTIETEGLNMVVDSSGNLVDQMKEDFLHPHSNQEDSDGIYYPDVWKKAEIKNNEILYQLSSDGKTFSSYFTDKKTVDSCTHNGVINFSELRDKLQIANAQEKGCLTVYKCRIT